MNDRQIRPLSFGEGLERYAPLFLMLDILVVAGLAYYRLGAARLIEAIAPALAAGKTYSAAALASDLHAAGFAIAALAALWLLCPFMKQAAAAIAIIFTAVFSAFLVLGLDFMRVYQTAFRKSFIGGEHFTGLSSMLESASAELSPISLIAITCIGALLAASTISAWVAAATKKPGRVEAGLALRFQGTAAAAAVFALAAGFSVNLPARLYASTASTAEAPSLEFAPNTVFALAFGPKRETILPHEVPRAVSEAFNSGSLENPDILRPIPEATKGKQSVILYFFESMSFAYYDKKVGGQYVVPRMRALAEKGLLLAKHYANYPLSANTLYTVLSSRYSVYGKSMIFRDYGDVDVHTLPEVLAKAGYSTCFIHSGDLLYAARDKFLEDRSIGTMLLEKDLSKDGKFSGKVGWGADERAMIAPAVEWIASRRSPYLLMMSPVSPHHPYAIPEGFESIVDPEEKGIGEGERNFRNYLNSLHYADAAMGEFVDALEEQGLMDNTIFVMVTDHGEAFYQHKGNYNHPLLVYEENVHVPALFYGPSTIPAQPPLESVTMHVDVLPSILDLLAVNDDAHRDGASIFSPVCERMAVFHTSWTDEYMGVRDGKWKYIQRVKDSREELYDLSNDPGEKSDLSLENTQIVERYRAAADTMAAYMLSQYADIPRKGSPGQDRLASE